MNRVATRIAKTAVAAALLETGAAAIRSHSFYPISIAMYAVMEIVYFLVVVCVAAIIAARLARTVNWLQRALFFGIVFAPSLFSYIGFFRNVTYYEEFGSALVIDHQITNAGFKELVLSGAISAVIALIASFIYFRGGTVSKPARVDG